MIGVGCLMLFIFFRLVACCQKKGANGTRFAANISNNILGMFLIAFNVMYLILCRTTMDVFNCKEMIPSDGHQYMVSTHERCWEEGGLHMHLIPYACLSLLVYAIGFPVAVGWLIFRNRVAINSDMELRAQHLHFKREASKNYGVALRYGRFYKYFRPDCKQWNMVIALRKFFLAGTALLFRRNPTFQLSVSLLGMFIAFVYQIAKRPYWSIEEQELYVKKLFANKNPDTNALVNKFIHNIQSRQANNQKGKGKDKYKGNKVGAEATKELKTLQYNEQQKVMANAKSWLFNLNTLEATTLASTVLVNLSGVMLLSGQFENLGEEDEYQRDMITYTVLAIIGFSFIYLGISFLREIYFARQIGSNFTRGQWRAVIKRQIQINKRKKAAGRRFQDVVYQVMRKHGVGVYSGSLAVLNGEETPKEEDESGPVMASGFFSGMWGGASKVMTKKKARVDQEPHAKPRKVTKVDLDAGASTLFGETHDEKEDEIFASAHTGLSAAALEENGLVKETDMDLY